MEVRGGLREAFKCQESPLLNTARIIVSTVAWQQILLLSCSEYDKKLRIWGGWRSFVIEREQFNNAEKLSYLTFMLRMSLHKTQWRTEQNSEADPKDRRRGKHKFSSILKQFAAIYMFPYKFPSKWINIAFLGIILCRSPERSGRLLENMHHHLDYKCATDINYIPIMHLTHSSPSSLIIGRT